MFITAKAKLNPQSNWGFSNTKRSVLQTRFKFVEAATRFELVVKVLQTCALPLGYAAKKMERKTRFELATLALARRCSTTEPFPQMVPRAGIEPATRRFSVYCSTD